MNETIPKDEDGEYIKCEMYVNDSRNETTRCTEWQYNLGNIGPTVASEVTYERFCNCLFY